FFYRNIRRPLSSAPFPYTTLFRSMAGCSADDIGYVNMHGTATVLNDAMEARAVREVIGPNVPVSSTKALTGHTLAGAGALEAAIDRKSTRLNSSHVKISYAVFCLK